MLTESLVSLLTGIFPGLLIYRGGQVVLFNVFSLCLSQFQLGTSTGQPPGISSKNYPGGRDLTFESCSGPGNSSRARILHINS